MKRKIKIIAGVAVILVLAVWFTLLAINPEPHFRATRNGVEVEMKHLTIEWLDENCELISHDKYSCPDNYVVEFWEQFK